MNDRQSHLEAHVAPMARHGWRGDPPADEVEARRRIVDAAMRCVDRYGPHKTGLSDVAKELGVTRQTVYRYFASTDDLLAAVGHAAAEGYLDRLAAHLARVEDPEELVVEALAFTIEQLPRERYLGLLLASGHSSRFVASVTSPTSVEFGRSLLERTALDWAALGYEREELDQLVEFALRMLQSLILDPATPQRRGPGLRAFLCRWVGPAISAHQRVGPALS